MLSSFSFSKDTIGFLIEGKVNTAVIENLQNRIEESFTEFDKINLYMEDVGIDDFTLPAVMDEILFKVKNSSRFNRIALVTNKKWIKMCGSIENLFMDAQIRSFDVEDRLQAMNWIAQPID